MWAALTPALSRREKGRPPDTAQGGKRRSLFHLARRQALLGFGDGTASPNLQDA